VNDADRTLVHDGIARLQRLAELFQVRRGQLARDVGLTETQWGVLEQIASEHFMPSMFARHHEQKPAAVSRVVRQLLDKHLITVAVADGDGRQRRYDLTARGRKTLERLRASRQDAIDAVWMQLDPAALRSFVRFGTDLITRLESYAAPNGGAPRRK
jgi:DNA-binding MarR family transcriptional regulator